MAVKLNRKAYSYAKKLIGYGKVVRDERDDWSEHQPSPEKENELIEKRGFAEYSKWYLGLDDEHAEDAKQHYKFPYGDFVNVHRSGLISAESRAGQYKYLDIEKAALKLRQMIDNSAV
jgi:hypothetical protein